MEYRIEFRLTEVRREFVSIVWATFPTDTHLAPYTRSILVRNGGLRTKEQSITTSYRSS